MPVFSRIDSFSRYIPVELCDLVIDSADREDLSTLSQVSPSWRRHAQDRLFEDIYLVAGPRCIIWYTIQTGSDFVPCPKILPDTFQGLLPAFARLDPALLWRVKAVTFRGLNIQDRRRAMAWSMGYGADPYVTSCVIRSFTRFLPNLRTINMSHVVWTSCLRSLLHPHSHRCIHDTDKRDLSLVSLSAVEHSRRHDSVFDILALVTSCHTLQVDDLNWPYTSLPIPNPSRLYRPDIRELSVRFPVGYSATLIGRHLPIADGLVGLDLKNVSYATHSEIRDTLRRNADNLETLAVSLGDECECLYTDNAVIAYFGIAFSVDMWQTLDLSVCQILKVVRLEMGICTHHSIDDCAGSSTLALFVSLLPRSVESLSVVVTRPAAPDDARRRIRTVPDWVELVENLKQFTKLYRFTLDIPNAGSNYACEDDPDDDPAFYAWKQYLCDALHPARGSFVVL